ncbi:hypothetical protein B2J93_8483 [Marssonina coronariae]|uniref:Uncharacterized protein n=1 Tax=Diplocarpon coronariae TaxID=2795749 RepID=A0A218YW47_9HELO|nr:hypothetical protein B2J93_8483 [Marssonina coronariae]
MSPTSSPPATKPALRSTCTEIEPARTAGRQQPGTGAARLVESAGLGLTVLALASAVVIVGTAGDSLGVYHQTTLGPEFPLALWPRDFDLRPTVALVTGGTITLLSSAASLLAAKIASIRPVAAGVAVLAPAISLVAALIGTSFFYGVDASATDASLQSWSCQWSSIAMDVPPHWSTLCAESKIALYLTVMLVPLQLFVLGTRAWGRLAAQKQKPGGQPEQKGSPARS